MVSSKPINLMIKTFIKSKARFLRFIPIKSFVEGTKYEISFRLENIGEEVFPGADLKFRIRWRSQQYDEEVFPIYPLKRNESYDTPKFLTDAYSDGYGLVFILDMPYIKDEKGESHKVEFYSGKRVEDYINIKDSIASIKSKSWEEIYEFWALIVASASLAIIALEKIWGLLMIWFG